MKPRKGQEGISFQPSADFDLARKKYMSLAENRIAALCEREKRILSLGHE